MTSVWIVSLSWEDHGSCVLAAFDHEPSDKDVFAAASGRGYSESWATARDPGEQRWYDAVGRSYLVVNRYDVITKTGERSVTNEGESKMGVAFKWDDGHCNGCDKCPTGLIRLWLGNKSAVLCDKCTRWLKDALVRHFDGEKTESSAYIEPGKHEVLND